MPMIRARQNAVVSLTAAALLAAVALSGCASSGAGTSTGAGAAPAGSPVTASSTKSATTAAAAGKLAGVPAACPAADEVMSNLHLSTLVVDGTDPSICQYLFHGDKSAPYVVITFNAVPGFTPAMVQEGLTKGQLNVKAVPGLADAAFSFTSSGGGIGLTFLSGDTVCSIDTTVPVPADAEVALARSILQG